MRRKKKRATIFSGLLTKGDPLVWLCSACVGLLFLLFATLIFICARHGLAAFWASDIHQFTLKDGSMVSGSIQARDQTFGRLLINTGLRDEGHLVWIDENHIQSRSKDDQTVLVELANGDEFIGNIAKIDITEHHYTEGDLKKVLEEQLLAVKQGRAEIASINDNIQKKTKEIFRFQRSVEKYQISDPARAGNFREKQESSQLQLDAFQDQLQQTFTRIKGRSLTLLNSEGPRNVLIMDIRRAYQPNQISVFGKLGLFSSKVFEFFTGSPRGRNGGLFPAIVGTTLMVFIMSLFCVPLGVATAIYLNEYLRKGLLYNTLHLIVNNLAGAPSIVYGIFGLGFFVHGVGMGLDSLWSSQQAHQFGNAGLLWASLIMALVTVPAVIVASEEGLNAVPADLRKGSIALGATRFQTLTRVLLPMASPSILTGLILAITRATGAVTPLIVLGAVQHSSELPIKGSFPFIELDQPFMHLGFHIFHQGFGADYPEAVAPRVYAAMLMLIVLVLGMSLITIFLRNRVRKRFSSGPF